MTRDEQWLLEEKYAGVATPAFEADKKRFAAGEPLSYVIGWHPFLGLKIYLDSHPLIPRPETEWWVEQMLAAVPQASNGVLRASASDGERHEQIPSKELCVPQNTIAGLRLLDLCAGSGAIGCAALARLPDAQVYFGEIDPAHEATIIKNIRENALDASRATVRIGDLFEPFSGIQFDLIAANPPYIPSARELPASVTDHEPARALYAGDDGLDIIRRIAIALSQHLAPHGEAWIELDSTHTQEARALFERAGFAASIRTDQYDRPRILVVSFS